MSSTGITSQLRPPHRHRGPGRRCVTLALALALLVFPSVPGWADATVPSDPTSSGTDASDAGSQAVMQTSADELGAEAVEPVAPVTSEGLSFAIITRATVNYTLDGSGDVMVDEDSAARARNNVSALCKAVIDDDGIALDLSVSPVLLERWAEDAGGAGGECISLISRAMETGRLELLSCGYSDPDIALLTTYGLEGDIEGQLALAARSTDLAFAPGFSSAHFTMTDSSLDELSDNGIAWCAVDGTLLMAGTANRNTYTSSVDRNLTLVSVSTALGDALLADPLVMDPVAFITDAESVSGTAGDLESVAGVDITNTANDCATLILNLRMIASSESVTCHTVGELVADDFMTRTPPPLSSIDDIGATASDDLALAFSQTSEDMESLEAGLYSSSASLDQSLWDYYAAQSAGLDEGLRAQALSLTKDEIETMFSSIHIHAQDIVLAGSNGVIPIEITDTTDSAFEVTVRLSGHNLSAADGYDSGVAMVLYTGENYVQIPVNLEDTRSEAVVEVLAGDKVVASVPIKVRTSHINLITGICGIVAAVIVVIAIVHRRHVRRKGGQKS